MVACTPSGREIVCEGCGAPVEEVTDDRLYPTPDDIAGLVYGQPPGVLFYICCPPRNGATPCLDAAVAADVLHYQLARSCGGSCCVPMYPVAYLEARQRIQARGGRLLP